MTFGADIKDDQLVMTYQKDQTAVTMGWEGNLEYNVLSGNLSSTLPTYGGSGSIFYMYDMALYDALYHYFKNLPCIKFRGNYLGLLLGMSFKRKLKRWRWDASRNEFKHTATEESWGKYWNNEAIAYAQFAPSTYYSPSASVTIVTTEAAKLSGDYISWENLEAKPEKFWTTPFMTMTSGGNTISIKNSDFIDISESSLSLTKNWSDVAIHDDGSFNVGVTIDEEAFLDFSAGKVSWPAESGTYVERFFILKPNAFTATQPGMLFDYSKWLTGA